MHYLNYIFFKLHENKMSRYRSISHQSCDIFLQDPKESESVRDLIELLKRIKESDHKESERLIAKERETDQDDETFHNRGSENSAKEIQNRENRGNELTEEQKRGLLDSIFSFFQSTEEDDDDGFFNGLIKTATNFLDGISGEITFSSIASALGLPTFGSMPSPSRPAWKHSDFSSGNVIQTSIDFHEYGLPLMYIIRRMKA